jgi:hypothetical protein
VAADASTEVDDEAGALSEDGGAVSDFFRRQRSVGQSGISSTPKGAKSRGLRVTETSQEESQAARNRSASKTSMRKICQRSNCMSEAFSMNVKLGRLPE